MKAFVLCPVLVATAVAGPRANLATEKLSGTVVIGGPLYSSEAAARAGKVGKPTSVARVVRVIRDRGDVVEVSTDAITDCVPEAYAARDEKFIVTVFARRDQLVPRLATAIVKTYPDGSAIAIDRGALLATDAMTWRESVLADAFGSPPDDVVYSLGKHESAQLPPLPLGTPLVCRTGQPMTFEAWKALPYAERGDIKYPPGCVVTPRAAFTDTDPPRELPAPKPPTVNGRPIVLRGDAFAKVYKNGSGYLGEIGAACARLRVVADPAGVQPEGSIAEGRPPPPWSGTTYKPRSGARVQWEDGRPAGTYRGTAAMFNPLIRETADRVCMSLVADEPVCFRRRDVVIKKR